MAEILLPIKELPKCCGLCPCFHAEHPMYCQADKTVRMTAPYGKRMEGCPLIALPEHEDLVEISKVKEALCIHGQASPWYLYVPVILEASK